MASQQATVANGSGWKNGCPILLQRSYAMAQIDAINQVINLVSLVVLLFAIVKTYRQVRSLNLLDYIIMYLKYRQTIYEEM